MRHSRAGLTLLELLVVVGILAVLIGLLLPAVQKVREVSLRIQSENNVKQFSLAVLTYTDNHDGRLPTMDYRPPEFSPNVHQSAEMILRSELFGTGSDWIFRWEQTFISPADPSIAWFTQQDAANRADLEPGSVAANSYQGLAPTSYTANAQVFRASPRYPFSIPDGVSNTIFYAERYADCRLNPDDYSDQYVMFAWGGPGFSRPADLPQVYPVTMPQGLSQPSRAGATFQIRPVWHPRPDSIDGVLELRDDPPPGYCDPTIPQTPHTAGMIVGLGDGSVRIVSAGISPGTFWSLVTPAGGEVIGSDW
jgi:type II secretory pathway pseudopilin PulG